MRKLVWIVFFFQLLGANLSAQQPSVADKPFIEVYGTAEIEIDPDEVFVRIVLTERPEGKDRIIIDKLEDLLKKEIRELGIDLSNLTVQNATADYTKFKMLKKEVVQSRQYVLKVNSQAVLSKLFERFDKINVTDAWIERIGHTKLAQFEKEAREKAVKSAREKADYMVVAAGMKLGMPLFMTENGTSNDGLVGQARKGYMLMEVADASEESEMPALRKLKVTSSVLIRFEIKP
jgi:hypothetical protein